MRKRLVGIGIAVLAVLAMVASVVASDSMPASKATAVTFDYQVLELNTTDGSDSTGWVDIMTAQLKTANQKDLFIDVSLQNALYTKTLVKSKGGEKDTSTAMAGLKVRVLVDGMEALPGAVTFNERLQELSATLQGQVDLVDQDGDGVIEEGELAVVDYEEISLLLNTISANAFNFIYPDLTSGVHTITVQAMIDVDASAQNGEAEAMAIIGAGSVTIEEVRMVKDTQVEM